ncbi:receptor-type tyrosine-protein phosphatase epsilon-like isoform X2 [Pecten maximus]|uniref:receptor-type tyrosine-protein phosphatase epsilon-like isoform X2 n=1 Tax=Pecten maximus TaxID=6579 RepID=UPI0014581BD0|nr:receptor-type tyrosine-protein phosphatase epsilon-like isoform X2 [Pecten maximus]
MATRNIVVERCLILILLYIFNTVISENNVAVNKTTEQSSNQGNPQYIASKVVDGCTSTNLGNFCCTHTAPGQATAWWRVDLGELMTITSIIIYYRNGFKHRLAGYELYVSNTTNTPTDGVPCFQDTSSTKSAVQLVVTHQCPYVGRYVTVYNYRNNPKRYNWYSDYAILELCEVQVYGCQAGKYGDGNCNILCPPACYGGNCNSKTGACFYCSPGKYDSYCNSVCPSNCNNSLCTKDAGACLDCVPRQYGIRCEQKCSTNCQDRLCEVNGNCYVCVPQKYGPKCELNCSTNCQDSLCEKDNGECYDCIPGKHDTNCDQNCSGNCKDQVCERDTGSCKECVAGKYSNACDQDCPGNCNETLCRRDSGHCIGCTRGVYGTNCSMTCNSSCAECDQLSGECTECKAGLYGMKCNITCGYCGICIKDTGICMTECDSGYKGHFCNTRQAKISESPPPTVDAGPIVGGIVGVFVVAGIAIVIVIIFRRRRLSAGKQESFTDIGRSNVHEKNVYSEPPETEHLSVKSESAAKNIYSNTPDPDGLPESSANVYVNTEQVARQSGAGASVYYNAGPVGFPVSSLKSLVQTKMKNKAKAFEDEYKSIPSGALHEHKVGMLQQNKAKNRFKTTFPYDHSRVILDKVGKDPHSDYINANYIDSVTKTAEYVATQGPRPGTVNDFWRMIWQLQTAKIVMLTNLIEGGRPKCDKYWPDEGESLTTTNFNIILDRERSYAFYVIRDLTVTEKKTKSVRQIHQFHYTTWPDHGTPDPNELVVFHRRVMKYGTVLTGKMVVHCSAGVGRTGTFIALDALLEYGKESGHIDVKQYIKTMRKDRINMVQTAEQYIAIHQLLIEAFDMPDTLIPRMKYHTTLTAVSNGGPTNQKKLRKEYQLTQTMKTAYDETSYRAAILPSNKMKNRTLSVVAVDKFRAYLRSYTDCRTDYINAVSVPSYTSKTGYIVTQTPLEDTVVDLLTMIMDHSCQTIVIIDPDDIDWLPGEGEDKSFGNFTLEHKGKSSTIANVDLLEIAIENAENSFNVTVKVFHMTGWDRESSVPKDSSMLLHLLELVDSRRKSDDTKATIVMCRDGYSQSGLFCCISNARDQMKSDEEVDIFQISRQMLVRRPAFVINFDQYQYCYNVIKDYLDTTDVYMN